MSSTTIRPFAAADLSSVMTMCEEHAAFEGLELPTTLFRPERLRQVLLDEASPLQCLVVEGDEGLVGYATFVEQWSTWHAGSYLYMDCLYLRAAVRGQGLGRQLMDVIQQEARRRDCLHVQWQTPTDNHDAIAFYQHLGATALAKQRFSWPQDSMTAARPSASTAGEPATNEPQTGPVPAPSGILPPPASLAEPYRDRPTRCTQQRSWQAGTLKVYEITIDGTPLPSGCIDAALACLTEHVVWPEEARQRYGFLTLNLGEQALWGLVQLWANDILRQFCCYAPLDRQDHFEPAPLPGFNACVWELEVTKHERDAWVRHVMAQPASPRFADYLNDTLTIPVTDADAL